ncbi:hydrogenase maturation nickel metallochaperone HypA [Streptomyces sp. MUM 203J]|uniref:hydrogenase maturation nickel metallochaperone HypA/HybF n=1 Tax=Streptomyces sp. MUM 203J TaxID=2791990 RepID=UPI001F03FA7B|nr:hydrogenase maturation nickel metallochaperone HypA [Streptomyces sp. MUM 203J]MCH0539239.1 hydrogenase maturation nickel metallochaperone HypA [Streptomyces sp. MUM 203J]
MHEMSLAVAVVDQVETAARSRGAVGVSSVELDVGELAGVVADALSFCFGLACSGTVVEGAELITRSVPGTARCGPCAGVWAVGMPPRLLCPGCGAAADELVSGRELRIREVRWTDPGAAREEHRQPITEES